MLKKRWNFLKMCSYHRVAENPKMGDIGSCTLDNQIECTGDIQSCQNPDVLNKYVLKRGLGWQKNMGRKGFMSVLQVIGRLANACWR
jgi:hypothetical protein